MSDTTNLSSFIKESFGSNSTYVEGLLERYRQDAKLVDDSWQAYFGALLDGGSPSVEAEVRVESATAAPSLPAASVPDVAKPSPAVSISEGTQAKKITGAAKKIVENMEQSLSVPTATSFRNIPV
ncbi:MAG: hypothetical protein H0X08_08370, partial [Blastocatellia bacterium]|nr:hypothetical protein [Blastocatellia bacterium]